MYGNQLIGYLKQLEILVAPGFAFGTGKYLPMGRLMIVYIECTDQFVRLWWVVDDVTGLFMVYIVCLHF